MVLTDGRNLWLAGQPVVLAPFTLGRPVPTLVIRQDLGDDPDELRLVRYTYRIELRGREHLAYHRHTGRHADDHLHFAGLPRLAIPTGLVAVEQVVGYCITELGAGPARVDWQDVLNVR